MSSLSRLTVLGGLLAAGLAYADTVTLQTTPAALGANDSVIWSPQLGADGATIPNAFATTSTGARAVNGTFTTTTGLVAKVGTSWTPASGDFNNGDFLVWAFDNGTNAGTGPVTLTFPNVNGVGAAVQSDAPGQFTVKLELFNGATSLGFVTRTSNVAGDAIFIGALDTTAANANKAVFSLTAGPGDNADFAMGPFSLNAPAPLVPDLSITKTHGGNFSQGQLNAVYTITVTNTGGAATTGTTTVTDTLPAGLSFVSGTGGGFNCSAVLQVVTCTNAAAIAAGASPAITLTVNVSASAAASVTNSATVTNASITQDADDTASDLTTINAPDLSIAKHHVGNFTQGQANAVYTITVTNTGAGATNGTTTVSDTLPVGLSFVSGSGGGFNCSAVLQVVTCTDAAAIAAGASPAITLTVNVAANAAALITNSATVSNPNITGDADDTASDPTTITAVAPDLSITKTHGGNFTQGQANAVYTITVTNTGNGATAGTTTVTDTLPAGLTFVSGTGGGFNCSAVLQVVTCTDAAAIAAGGSSAITLTVSVAANAPALVTNSATVTNPNITGDADDTASDPTTIVPPPPSGVLISYAANLGSGQSFVNLTNAGTDGGNDKTDSICANVYVLAEDQQLIECCTCPMTPNHLRTLSVQKDLINNTLTPGVPIGVTIELVTTTGAACNASAVSAANLAPGLKAWSTTLHAAPGGGFAVTENHFLSAGLSPSELNKLTSYCSFIQANGSNFGVCNACKDGAQGANRVQ